MFLYWNTKQENQNLGESGMAQKWVRWADHPENPENLKDNKLFADDNESNIF
jgi:hypothetical protein